MWRFEIADADGTEERGGSNDRDRMDSRIRLRRIGQEPPSRDWIEAPLKATLDRFKKSSERQPIRSSTHTFTNAAFAALLEESDAAAAERFLATTLAAQDMDAASKTYGQFKWTPSDAAVTDRNAVEFNIQGLAPLLVSHGGDLSAAFRQTLQPHLVAALAGMRRSALRFPTPTFF